MEQHVKGACFPARTKRGNNTRQQSNSGEPEVQLDGDGQVTCDLAKELVSTWPFQTFCHWQRAGHFFSILRKQKISQLQKYTVISHLKQGFVPPSSCESPEHYLSNLASCQHEWLHRSHYVYFHYGHQEDKILHNNVGRWTTGRVRERKDRKGNGKEETKMKVAILFSCSLCVLISVCVCVALTSKFAPF